MRPHKVLMKGLDTMQKEGQMRITTLNEFMEWAQQLPAGGCLFRGVPNEKYKIQASAYRRPKEEDRDFENFFQINKSLIRDARLLGYDERNGRELRDLEILAELQHFGAATCLIDFTYSAQVALWFACQLDAKTSQDLPPPNGRVFAVRSKSSRFKEITPKMLKEGIAYFLQGNEGERAEQSQLQLEQLYQWQPRQQNNRIIAQQSIFLFGDSQFNADAECVILESSKQDIRTKLQQVSGITEAMLFPDFDGFARLRGEDIPYTQLSAFAYFDRAGVNANLLARRGVAYKSDEYQEAINDYEQVIRRYASSAPKCAVGAYWNLGDLMHKSGCYEKARDYFQKGLKIAQEGDFAYFHESLWELHRDMDRHDSEDFEDDN